MRREIQMLERERNDAEKERKKVKEEDLDAVKESPRHIELMVS